MRSLLIGQAHPRRLALLGASFHFDGSGVSCKIQSISGDGVLLRSETTPEHNTNFPLTIRRFGTMSVRSVRTQPNGMGCSLVEKPARIEVRIGHLLLTAE
ncbi:MAG TPA: hypothetical protein QF813_09925 [Alphaproteobacteria bacterium]|jgi:hypothetical protein|nr:hypothetical protein [Alphaproteobacteria bacterium]|tara:strand:- start:236 stop:535 length:300 start_codon:yes stop_codon:yes gene_type:complete